MPKSEAAKLKEEVDRFVKKMDEVTWDPSMRSNEVSFAYHKTKKEAEELGYHLTVRTWNE